MAKIVIIGEDRAMMDIHALALTSIGHAAEILPGQHAGRDRLAGSPVDVVIVDVDRPDGGHGLLAVQARSAWPDALIIVLISGAEMTGSKISRMGLWAPDKCLRKPVSAQEIATAVSSALQHGRQ